MNSVKDKVLQILIKVEKNEGYSHVLLNRLFQEDKDLSGADKALIKRLMDGCLERQLLLDHFVGMYSKTPVKKQKPLIRVILRMGVYQILYMDSVPSHAAVNECVELAKAHGFKPLSGFVNGVLRTVSKNADALLREESRLAGGSGLTDISLTYSIPDWIIKKWKDEYPEVDIRELLEAIRGPKPLSIRLSPGADDNVISGVINELESCGARVCKAQGTSPITIPYYEVRGISSLGSLSAFKKGLFTVQDKSSGLAIEALGIAPGDSVVDVCAAPGGKMALAAQLAGADGRVIGMDISQGKQPLIMDYIKRLSIDNATAVCHDSTKTRGELVGKFDKVICDVPCSGLGVISRKKEICYRVKPGDIDELIKISYDIISASVPYLKENGRLLFSTCTVSAAENQLMARRIEADYHLDIIAEKQLFPNIDATDGFYYCVFERARGFDKE